MIKVKEDMTGWVMAEHGVHNSRLTVIEQVEDYIDKKGRRRAQWLCQCSCEEHNKLITLGESIKSGKTLSCGCLQKTSVSNTGHNNKKTNKFDLETYSYGVGWTTNTNREFYFDLEDYDKIKDYCWTEIIRSGGYHDVSTNIGTTRKTKTLAQIITEENNLDHIDRNPFNNRKENFRKADKSQNSQNAKKYSNNSSGFTGVQWNKQNGTWMAFININKKRTYLGSYSNKRDAIVARLKAEKEHYGEFAPQRHLFEEYCIN